MCCRDWPNWPGSQLTNLTPCNCWQIYSSLLNNSAWHLDWGLGPPVWSSEENGVADYALQAIDKKAALPSQVQAMCHFWYFSCSVHHLLVCNNRCFTVQPCLLSTTPSVWESLDYTILGPYAWQRGSHIQINGNVRSRFIWSASVS